MIEKAHCNPCGFIIIAIILFFHAQIQLSVSKSQEGLHIDKDEVHSKEINFTVLCNQL